MNDAPHMSQSYDNVPIATVHQKPGVARRLLPYVGVAACTAAITAGVIFSTQPERDTKPVVQAPEQEKRHTETSEQQATEIKAAQLPIDELVTVDYAGGTLDQALTDLHSKVDMNMVVNWQALELVGIDRDDPVALKLNEVPGRKVLQLLLEQVSADAFDDDKASFRASEQMIKVSTIRDLKKDVETRVYDIRSVLVRGSIVSQLRSELLSRLGAGSFGGDGGGLFGEAPQYYDNYAGFGLPLSPGVGVNSEDAIAPNSAPPSPGVHDLSVPSFSNAPGFDLNDALSGTSSGASNGASFGSGGGGLFGDDDDDEEEDLPSRQELIDQLTELVQVTVGDPDEWLDEESTLTELNGNFIIKTTPENHEQIQGLMAALVGESDKPELAEEKDNLVRMMLKDFEQGLIQIEERRERREAERLWRERFATITDNPFKPTSHEPLSTFSVDVDTASYTYARSSILDDLEMPTPDAVRIEEWINYFDYGYTAPVVPRSKLENGLLTTAALARIEAADESFAPFTPHVEVVDCPWTPGNKLVRVGLKAMEVEVDTRPPAHLVFLLDVSGSMNASNKLDLVKEGMPMLLNHLKDGDKVSIVVYAGASGLILEAADAADKNRIEDAIMKLQAGGSTAGGEGIQLAYQIAQRHFVQGGINRVILCTDGDFNVGVSNTGELVELVKTKANPKAEEGKQPQGVYLSVMGFGRGNLNDEMMEMISNAGNGNYAYIDRLSEAVKTMSEQVNGTLITVAKDVKIQIEFNPNRVASYRLIGYENRVLNDEDFNDDTVDAGDIGSGHSVTALYEIVPAAEADDADKPAEPDIDELRYQKPRTLTDKAGLDELLTLKLRYKPVDAAAVEGTSRKIVKHVPAESVAFDQASEPTRFAASIAGMGMLLRGSPHRGEADFVWVLATASEAIRHDPNGLRQQFVDMVDKTMDIRAGENE